MVSSIFSGRSESHVDFTLRRAIFPLWRQNSGALRGCSRPILHPPWPKAITLSHDESKTGESDKVSVFTPPVEAKPAL